MYWAMLPAAVLGTVKLVRRKVPVMPMMGILVLVTIHAAIFFGFVRHRISAEIPLVVLAAVGVHELLSRLRPSDGAATRLLDR